ncbi:malate/lactate/ureidoglycolate dehydrogenase [Caballeronia sp. LZ065]|uniref:malate/lactate/ureidoglycolate dehydrogenase n=1 Tax=Caballeronia sp. LZ065 TaxID=3038571 RepID=UPI0028575403|nr:malate/lactate/ureidoglycolate dehydrogenase [Caballeronia sp. LZ065]MDR5783474.1 malate/lactate/ureidoglycolate dehydrogenase [Caballeronia sp. LZ065]
MNASSTPSTNAPDRRIAADTLHAYVRAIWTHAGSAPREAELIADHLVMSNLSGHDSHGIGMIPRYVASLAEGQLQLNTHAEIVRDAGAVLSIDGRKGFGQVVAYEAMEHGIERARKLGVCAVGLRNAHHIGRIGHWAEQCAKAGLVSFHFVNVAGDPLVAPFGGIDSRFGTNPFCAAYPRDGKAPLVLDFATAGIAYGKTRVAYNKGVKVAPGMLLDHEGHPTVEPKVMHEEPFGTLTAFGLHKGSGLAALCEIFGGALSGGYTTHESTLEKTSAIMNCMTSVILDPNAFDAPAAQQEAEAFLAWMKASPRAEGVDEILAPGDAEEARRAEYGAKGIAVDPTTWRQIRESAEKSGMPQADVERYSSALK